MKSLYSLHVTRKLTLGKTKANGNMYVFQFSLSPIVLHSTLKCVTNGVNGAERENHLINWSKQIWKISKKIK